MRLEKQYLVQAVDHYLNSSDYVFVADYTGITVKETAELRNSLKDKQAVFHVAKNSAISRSISNKGMPELDDILTGPTAFIVGGENPSEVAKILKKFNKDNKKVEVKGGVLSGKRLSKEEVSVLADLPSLDALRAQLLSLFNEPATQMARVLNAKSEQE